jgi:hypothetical protein
MKTNLILAITFIFFIIGSSFGQTGNHHLDDNFVVKKHDFHPTELTSITTNDNENNLIQGIPDYDMDVYLYNDDYNVPIEFNIFVDDPVITTAQLSILNWDVDWDCSNPGYCERDEVYFNGQFIGYLTGANGEWSTSVFAIDPSLVIPGPNGKNLIQIYVDVLNSYANWAVQIDWGQLVINEAIGTANFRYVLTDKACYEAGEIVSITEEVDADIPMYVRVETNLVDPLNQIVAGTSRYFTATIGDEPFTEYLTLPASAMTGNYQVLALVYDGNTNIQQDIEYVPFQVGCQQCVNPTFAGEIGNAQGNCGEFDPLPFTSVQLPSGYVGTLEYKWQYSTDFVSFFDIANSNLETYDPGLIAQTTWFKRLARVDCMNDWMGAAESNVLEITIYDPIAVAISESLLPEFCQGQGVNLTANVSITPAVSYLWSTGETTQTIFTGISGIYTVTVTNAMGCEATASYDLTVDVTDLLSSYVMLARGIIQMDKTTVHSGGLGVKAGASNKVLGLNYTTVTAEGTFAKAPNIFMDWTTNITNKIYEPCTVVWPAFEPLTNPGTVNVVVPNNATMTLSGNAYKTVKIGKNATVIFTEPVVDINGYLTMNLGSKIEFVQCTKIHLKGKFTAGKNVIINPDELSVVFYIEGDVTFGSGAHVAGVFYLSNAEVYNFDVANSTVNLPGMFKGMFLAKVIYSGKNNNWYMSTMCNNCTSVNVKNLAVESPGIITGSGAVLKNYPNPFSDKTTVNFMLPEAGHVTIDVFNLSGKLVQSLYNGDVNMNQEYTVEFDGSTLSKGLYIYKMTTNNEVVTGKMIVR